MLLCQSKRSNSAKCSSSTQNSAKSSFFSIEERKIQIAPKAQQCKMLIYRPKKYNNTKCFCFNLKGPTVQNAHFSTQNNEKHSFSIQKGETIQNAPKTQQCKMLIYQPKRYYIAKYFCVNLKVSNNEKWIAISVPAVGWVFFISLCKLKVIVSFVMLLLTCLSFPGSYISPAGPGMAV